METINHEYHVSFEVAKLLKKAGFDWDTYNGYNKDGVFADKSRSLITWNHFSDYYSAPTLEVAQRWLRDVKNCYVSIVADCDSVGVFYTTRIIYYDTDNNYHATYVWEEIEMECVQVIFNNYEETQEACIKKALKIILEGGE